MPLETQAHTAPIPAPPLALEYARRGRIAAELARRALDPVKPFPHGAATAPACVLYHHSIVWSLQSLVVLARRGGGEADLAEATAAPPSRRLDELWRAADAQRTLARLHVTDDEIAQAQSCMAEVAADAELPAEHRERGVSALRMVAEALVYAVDVALDRPTGFSGARAALLGLGLLVLGAIGWGGVAIRSHVAEQHDIARGMQWRVSSTTLLGCKSPAQRCDESPHFFFHTLEQGQPWLEIDLGSVQRFKSVKVVNRDDCCFDRAAPMQLEVSKNHRTWEHIARKDEVFSVWQPEFAPVEARWVRLRVEKKVAMHLLSVGVYQ